MKKILFWFLILQSLSFLTVGAYQIWLQTASYRLSFAHYSYAANTGIKGMVPERITIASLGIDLPIYKATIVHNIWPTTDFGASYLTSSPLPGDKGNSIIYAHNWISLFGKLRNAKIGDKVVITYPDHIKKTFVIEYTSIVTPNESSILAPSKDRRITMYTCTGFLDTKRFVAVAILQKS